MVSRRALLAGSTAVMAGGLTVAQLKTAAVAAPGVGPQKAGVPPMVARAGFGMPLPGGLICPVPFVTRAGWGANESLRWSNNGGYWPEEYLPVQTLTVHHTGYVGDADPATFVRQIYERQTTYGDSGLGWGDIGYHLLIDWDGVVYEGRYSGDDGRPVFAPGASSMVTAAHIGGWNAGNIGVCLLGYLNDTGPTAAASDALVTVLAYLAAAGGVNPLGTVGYHNPVNGNAGSRPGIGGHRDWAATDCPGNALYPLLSGIRQRVAAGMPSVPQPQPTQPQPTPSQPTPSEPTPSQPTPSQAQPTPAQPTQSTSGPEPSDSGESTVPAETPPAPEVPTPQTPAQPQTPTQPQNPPAATGGRERGGDEYVAQAREETPESFPTVAPSEFASASAPASPSPSRSATRVTSRLTGPPAIYVATDSSGSGVVGAAVTSGVVATGMLGLTGWWWRRRRALAGSEAAGPMRVVDEPTVLSVPAPATGAATTSPGNGG